LQGGERRTRREGIRTEKKVRNCNPKTPPRLGLGACIVEMWSGRVDTPHSPRLLPLYCMPPSFFI